ncbi:MAG TPA: hypothetical protein PK752_06005 [Accumulibacter sp.]|uniref:hypothetical protein n=1 Tax=Accumulibacter sp. TaxID=2053492 RepID=UPI002CD69D19|nr:hypothetical protein [Accumulibacter sp.]HRD87803.1 hypothetical protein [Accumulibacter sp.]
MNDQYEDELSLSDAIIGGLVGLTKAITPIGIPVTADAAGVGVESLTESVMGVTAGLVRIAYAIEDLASAVREHGQSIEIGDKCKRS